MKRLLVYGAAIASVGVLAAPAAAVRGATISVTFDSNATTATIKSSRRISTYTVQLCSGPRPRARLMIGRRLTIGPFGSPIVSVTVRSARTVQTFASGASCQPGTEVPESASALLLPLSILGTLGLVGAFTWHRRRQVSLSKGGHVGHA
jgi:hypothetical protein